MVDSDVELMPNLTLILILSILVSNIETAKDGVKQMPNFTLILIRSILIRSILI